MILFVVRHPRTAIGPLLTMAFFGCGITTDCESSGMQAGPRKPAGSFKQVAANGDRFCAVKTDGRLACWGFKSNGEEPSTAETFVQVELRDSGSMAPSSSGRVWQWGATARQPL